MQRFLDDLGRDMLGLVDRLGGDPCVVLLALVALDVWALGCGYKYLTGSVDGKSSVTVLAVIAVSISLTIWYLLRFAAALGQGGGLST